MEELRSTQILDNEIKTDATKKAQKILDKAQKECSDILCNVSARVNEAISQKEKDISLILKSYASNAKAVLPLGKQRFKVAYDNEHIMQAIKNYLATMGQENRLNFLASYIVAYKKAFSEKDFSINYYNMTQVQANLIAKKAFGREALSYTEANPALSCKDSFSNYEGIVIQAADDTVRANAFIWQIITDIYYDNSKTLCHALFGR